MPVSGGQEAFAARQPACAALHLLSRLPYWCCKIAAVAAFFWLQASDRSSGLRRAVPSTGFELPLEVVEVEPPGPERRGQPQRNRPRPRKINRRALC